MDLDLPLLLRAVGVALVLEGLVWALLPGGMRRAMRLLLREPDASLRGVGIAAVAAGLVLVWLAV